MPATQRQELTIQQGRSGSALGSPGQRQRQQLQLDGRNQYMSLSFFDFLIAHWQC